MSTLHFPYPPEKRVLKPELCKLALVQFLLSLGFTSEHLPGQRGVPALSLCHGEQKCFGLTFANQGCRKGFFLPSGYAVLTAV